MNKSITAYDNTVCIYIKCDGFEFPIAIDDARRLIEELSLSISTVQSRTNTIDEKGESL